MIHNALRMIQLLYQFHDFFIIYTIKLLDRYLTLHYIQGTAPIYLSSMLKRAQGHYRLRSSNEIRFTVPRTRTRAADRSIAVVGPKWWNALPNDIKTCTNETSFRSKLKTQLFEKFYN